TTAQDVCRAYPHRVRSLLAALDMDRPGLEQVKAAAEHNDLPAACTSLIAYYRSANTTSWLRVPTPPSGAARDDAVDPLLEDTFTFQAVTTSRQPRLTTGGLDWQHQGPSDDREWAISLSRHDYFNQLLRAWRQTGNSIYAATFDEHIRDWVVHHPTPERLVNDYAWVALNPGIRLGASWPQAFFGFQQARAFTPAGRILMLSSIPEQCAYLTRTLRRNHNFAVLQMQGLGLAALAYPEFREAEPWYAFAEKELTRELSAQVYSDGVQKELTSDYHMLALSRFAGFAEQARRAGRTLPPQFDETIERMWTYAAYAMRPNGTLPLNNDSDLSNVSARVLEAAQTYQRDDWRYLATQGREGVAPHGPPSAFFPWGGQLVSRSGWSSGGADSGGTSGGHWSFFDVGPWGAGHQHNDMLHLSIHAFGRDVLVDSGRFAYSGEIARKFRHTYALHSRGHNVVFVDGLGQCSDQREATRPHEVVSVRPGFDFCRGSFTAGYSGRPHTGWGSTNSAEDQREIAAIHARAVVYLRGLGWIVADCVTSDQPRTLMPLWHFHPSCTIATEGTDVVSVDRDQGNLRITPTGEIDWDLRVVKGQEQPYPQGWYSPTYNVVEASPCAEYTATVASGQVFGWLIIPGQGVVPKVMVERLSAPQGVLRLRLTPPGGESIEVAICLCGDGDEPIALSGGLTLEGACAVLMPGQAPRAACGRLRDRMGAIVHEASAQALDW
ncbi:MAG: heparinase II/III family protein, partial [Phycisphaeraceae bacterium]